MTEGERQFLSELAKEIDHHPESDQILTEYEGHIHELLQEVLIEEEQIYDHLVQRLGSPKEIAQLWQQEVGITPKKTQWLFVLFNIGIFVGGTILTISYHVFHWQWIDRLWAGFTELSFIVILIYTLFWGLLGYEIGKEFGHRGYRLLKRTFIISIIPNILLMYLIVFRILPHEWFKPFLSVPFIVICIVFTGLLYPVSLLGYRWGRKVSV